jgi:hypothetical protein
LGRNPNFERIDADRLSDVFELGCAEIANFEIETPLHLPVGLLGETDRARLGDALEPRRNIVAVALLDNVADMDADAELDAFVGRDAHIALGHAGLHFDRAAHRVNHAAELNDYSVAGAFDDVAVVDCDSRVDRIAAKGPESSEDAIFVRASKPGVADNVCHQDRREFPGLAHGTIAEAARSPVALTWAWLHFHAALRAEGVEAGSAGPACRPAGLSTPR